MGKSASGKDSIYRRLVEQTNLPLKKIIPYTTRPIRSGETHGVEYYFVTKGTYVKYMNDKKVIEFRMYHTVDGEWIYFTADDGQIVHDGSVYLMICTLSSYYSLFNYFNDIDIIPIYVYLDDGERLQRALTRENMQSNPNYHELCRRFLADESDFSEDNLKSKNIHTKFINDDIDICVKQIREFIQSKI